MPLFDETLADAVVEQVRARYAALGALLGATPARTGPKGPLRTDLLRLIAVANGEKERTRAEVRETEAALLRVLDALLGTALGPRSALPAEFWRSEIGVVVARVRWWVAGEDLITISNAAALAFGTNTQAHRMRIARAIDSGLLEWVPDPSVSNPQQNKRVLRPQVERLRDLSRLPE